MSIFFVKYIYYSFKTFGLAAVSLEVAKNSGRKVNSLIFKSSKSGTFYNLSLIILMTTLYYFALEVGFVEHSALERKRFDRIIHNVHNLSAGLACSSILLYFCFTQNKITEVANELRKISESIIEIDNES